MEIKVVQKRFQISVISRKNIQIYIWNNKYRRNKRYIFSCMYLCNLFKNKIEGTNACVFNLIFFYIQANKIISFYIFDQVSTHKFDYLEKES